MTQRIVLWLWLATCLSAAISCTRHARPPKVAAAAPVKRDRCFAERDPRGFELPVRAHDWVSLLVDLELGRGGVYARRDCLGQPIRYSAPKTCSEQASQEEIVPQAVPIAQESVVARDLGGSLHAIWIVTHRFDDGDGYGPLALVRREKAGLRMLALGSLRMRSDRVKLEHWQIHDHSLVVASGETCARDGDAEGCRRNVRLTLQRGDRLLDAPVLEPSGRCLQMASFELARKQERTLPSGLLRSFELSANITHNASHVIVEERLLVRDVDPTVPMQPAREVQHVEMQRLLQPEPGRLVSKQPSLWSRAVERSNEPVWSRGNGRGDDPQPRPNRGPRGSAR